jgi:hypothetical protein
VEFKVREVGLEENVAFGVGRHWNLSFAKRVGILDS